MHPPEKEIEQRRQETCMVKQGASRGDQTEEKGPWNVERGKGHLGRVQERGESMQGCDEEGQGPPGIESWQGMSKTTRRASSTTSAAKGRLGTMWGRC